MEEHSRVMNACRILLITSLTGRVTKCYRIQDYPFHVISYATFFMFDMYLVLYRHSHNTARTHCCMIDRNSNDVSGGWQQVVVLVYLNPFTSLSLLFRLSCSFLSTLFLSFSDFTTLSTFQTVASLQHIGWDTRGIILCVACRLPSCLDPALQTHRCTWFDPLHE
ncbi:hypothetical protein BCR34DRAFT_561736 [Clohesyomyces aquaticus]|uniref:Uncharacterized protein n=1 Tax=Clohesyomyces aquaticus TaxID=1231657 RepID=A0A1Y1ZUW1_9PLEO|nr:hypothetical protein BCR34DRAFT_561736 [Clohesyomyces aquaticus]